MSDLLSKKISTLFSLLLIIGPLLFFPSKESGLFYLTKISVVYVFFFMMTINWIFQNRKKLNQIKDLNKIKYLLLIYFVFLSLSVIFSIDFEKSIRGSFNREEGYIALTIYLLLFFYALEYFNLDETVINRILTISVIVCIYGMLQYYGFSLLDNNGVPTRPSATFGNPNFFSSYLVLLLPIPSFLFIKFERYRYLVVSQLQYIVLLMTMTRGGWLGFIFSYILLTILLIKEIGFSKTILKINTAFLLTTLAYFLFFDKSILIRLMSIFGELDSIIKGDSSIEFGSYRIFIWNNVLKLIKERPLLGFGPETLGDVFKQYYFNEYYLFYGNVIFDKAHNEYLHIAVTSGIPALTTYIIFILSILKKTWKNRYKNTLILPIFCSVVGYLIQAFFNISVVSVAYMFWIFLGALMYMVNQDHIDILNKQKWNEDISISVED